MQEAIGLLVLACLLLAAVGVVGAVRWLFFSSVDRDQRAMAYALLTLAAFALASMLRWPA